MRIPSGVTDQYIYFVAVDSADYTTRETGLSSFTVYRSRNGGVAAAMTTPTVNETSSANMPGVYELLLDEDTTIGSGNDSEEMAFHITHAGMAPVTRTIELYRPKITAGETLTVSSGTGNAAVQSMSADSLTASALATDAVTEIQSGLATSSALATVDGNVDAILVDTGTTIPAQITGLNNISAAEVNSEVDAAIETYHLDHLFAVDYDPASKPGVATALLNELVESDAGVSRFTVNALENAPSGTGASADTIADAVWAELSGDHTIAGSFGAYLDTVVSGVGGGGLTLADIADAVWDEAQAGHTTAGTFGEIATEVASVKGVTDALPDSGALTSLAQASSLATVDANVDAILVDTGTTLPGTLATLATSSALATVDATADAIKVKTDSLTFTVAGQVDANVTYVNDTAVTGDGQTGTEWGPA